MTRYFVHMADEILRDPDLQLPDGFRINAQRWGGHPVWTVEVEDDGASPELEGKLVEVVFRRTEFGVEIMERDASGSW